MSDDNREAAIKAVRHELNEVEALTEYSERGAREICEAVVRVVLEAMAPSVSPECICGHPQLAHEDDVGFCWDCDACAADPACREFVERVLKRPDGSSVYEFDDQGHVALSDDSHWATVVINAENFEPRELAEAEAVELYESGLGIAVERMWIRPGVRKGPTATNEDTGEVTPCGEALPPLQDSHRSGHLSAEQELKDVKHAYEREVELADRRAAELDALIAAANTAIASNSLGNIQAWLDACGRASR